MNKGLYRSRRDSIIGGVAGGLAESLRTDSTLIRVLFVLMTVFWGGGILLYIIFWIALPLDNDHTLNTENMENDNQLNEEQKKDQQKWTRPKNDGGLIAGLILIALGVIFLIVRFVPRIDFGDLWPVILLVAGIALIWSSLVRKKNDEK